MWEYNVYSGTVSGSDFGWEFNPNTGAGGALLTFEDVQPLRAVLAAVAWHRAALHGRLSLPQGQAGHDSFGLVSQDVLPTTEGTETCPRFFAFVRACTRGRRSSFA